MDFMLLLLVMLLRQEVAALKLLHINVPAYTLRGRSALLECRYDRERDRLYGITWYKDHEVFYKYVLRDKNPHVYDVSGVKVDKSHSDDQKVTLQDANLHASGVYKCEVNGEGPSFNTVSAEARMEVIALPQERPMITGEEKVYASGDVLALNCTSGKSHPAAKLRWFVNDQQVRGDGRIGSQTRQPVRRYSHHRGLCSRSRHPDDTIAMSVDGRSTTTISTTRVDPFGTMRASRRPERKQGQS
ncbi:cell adhesion molecule 2-like isoform X2 [Temnothorax nylanderi]|uniref:cell adhesion molecule 2-like isoform X2 n=1 Tax=Temnothorax nylanderi TaxID=102681 RepID=UPI003A83C632